MKVVKPDEIAGNIPEPHIVEEDVLDGNVTLQELIILSKLVTRYQPKTIFEIGTFDGRTTINLANVAPDDAKVFTLDLPRTELGKTKYPTYEREGFNWKDATYIDKEEIGHRYKGKPTEKKITQLLGDSATFDFSPYYNKMDFVFVDGSHAYEYTKNDTEIAFKLLRNGSGIIVWHDYGVWPDVTRFFDELGIKIPSLNQIKGTTLVILKK